MKPILRKYYKKMPMITCESCGERIKDGSRIIIDDDGSEIIEEEIGPFFHGFVDYEEEPTLQGSYQFKCDKCGISLHSLLVTIASDPWVGTLSFGDRLWKKDFHSLYTVKCGHLRWAIDRFIDVAFKPKDKNEQTNNRMSWVDVHRIGGFISPERPSTQAAQFQKLSQLYVPFIERVRKK